MHKLTQKRQVTVPQQVCQALGLEPGNYVEIFERDGVGHIVKMSLEKLEGKFSDRLKNKEFPTATEMKNAVKKRAASKFEGK